MNNWIVSPHKDQAVTFKTEAWTLGKCASPAIEEAQEMLRPLSSERLQIVETNIEVA